MLRDSTMEHPADAPLVNALRAAMRDINEGQEHYARIMSKVQQKYGDQPDNTPVPVTFDDEKRFYPYQAPENIRAAAQFIADNTETIADELTKCPSMEMQEDVLLTHMRALLDSVAFTGLHPEHARVMFDVIDHTFARYASSGEKMSRELLDMRTTIRFYARICYDSLECMQALTSMMPEHRNSKLKTNIDTPFAVAWRRYLEQHPVEEITDDEGMSEAKQDIIFNMAKEAFAEALDPYIDVLPETLSSDMPGILLRCAEHCGEYMRPRTQEPANENDSAEEKVLDNMFRENHLRATQLLANPAVRWKTKRMLQKLMCDVTDACKEPHSAMEVAQGIDELQATELKRTQAARTI